MKVCRLLGFLLLFFACTTAAQSVFEERFIEVAKALPVQRFDPALPPLPLHLWVSSVAMPQAEVTWEVNDCGEQTGSPADEGRDFPACVEAIFAMATGTYAHISIMMGTFNRGVVGQPVLFQLFVEGDGKFQEVDRLSEIPALSD